MFSKLTALSNRPSSKLEPIPCAPIINRSSIINRDKLNKGFNTIRNWQMLLEKVKLDVYYSLI